MAASRAGPPGPPRQDPVALGQSVATAALRQRFCAALRQRLGALGQGLGALRERFAAASGEWLGSALGQGLAALRQRLAALGERLEETAA